LILLDPKKLSLQSIFDNQYFGQLAKFPHIYIYNFHIEELYYLNSCNQKNC